MNISCEPRSIRILSSNGNRLATASITIDGAFVVRNLSLMNGSKGMFVNILITGIRIEVTLTI